MVIKRVGPVSCAKISGTLYGIIGLIVGGVFSMMAMAGAFASDDSPFSAGFGAVLGAAAIVVFPLFYGCIGFVATLVGAWLYNVVAGLVGGIEVEVQ
jgi:hypothetical protein